MDPSHSLKKARNSVLCSGFLQSHQLLHNINGKFIMWKTWIGVFTWNRLNTFKTLSKLINEHILPNGAPQMRNKLAFESVWFLIIFRWAGESESGNWVFEENQCLSFFTDSRPIKDKNDQRLTPLKEKYDWFKAWEDEGYV
jgi:hypothetical protein